MVRAGIFASLLAYASGRPVLPVPTFNIDLDLDPEERFKEVIAHFEEPLYGVYNAYATNAVVRKLYEKLAAQRGPENDELAGEIRGISKYSKIPLEAIQAAQLLYELQTIMVPVENITWPWNQVTQRTGQEPAFGCTGIIARSADDATVTHARNLDFSFAKWLGNMTYNGVFHKQGKELFTAQMIAGYSMPLTGMRRGKNGYTIEINTRYPPKEWNVKNLLDLLFKEKRASSGWIKRQVLQDVDNFEDAVKAFSTRPYASTEFNIISGNQKGVILARNPDDLYHKLTLGPNKNDYILMTNFDYWDHDFKEWLDPTSIHFGHSRRIGAEKILNASTNINSDQLYKTLNDDEVVAKDTIFQALMNVETDSYKTFLPDCKDCSGCVDTDQCLKKGEDCCGERSHYTLKCGTLGGYRCGCLPDGVCRSAFLNTTKGDEDCCSFESHFTLDCPGSARRCGAKPSSTSEYV
jgi:hypothetical protein